ncbi:pantetheine-phosphate adenylyltransferase [Candidatus Bathyarchaeota archaeon]|nr:pantetheine-phosphate adenylyltransferase [Candidatus Bathyarchaeota archaeon]
MAEQRLKTITVAGTFDVMHKGHWYLLDEAFRIAEQVLVGITTDRFAASLKKPHVIDPYHVRLNDVQKYLKNRNLLQRTTFFPLDDPYGIAINNSNLEGILVSEETEPRAEEINQIRVNKGKKPLLIFVMKMVLADDGKPISSTRVRRQEVDRYGRLIG